MTDSLRALVVDDDTGFRSSLAMLVEREGFSVEEAGSIAEVRARGSRTDVDIVLADLGLPDGSGLDLLRDEDLARGAEVIVITGNATVESSVAALREGALDYLTKPVDRARLKTILANFSRTRDLKAQVRGLREELRELGRFGNMVGRSAAMQEVYDLIEKVAPTHASVLISGESGTGKELAAETIHRLSRRRSMPFLAVNAGAVAKSLIDSELFGHEKGSFTGADRGRRGYFEEVHGGTLFLDEITEMPAELQVKLLRALESGSIIRVGGSETIRVDVRVIAATNRNPEEAVASGTLRKDLYYRLNVFPIRIPPLRERTEDIDALADRFLADVNRREGTRKAFAPDARGQLRDYPWPGNVRELKNVVERAAIMAEAEIGARLLPVGEKAAPPGPAAGCLEIPVGTSLEDAERRLILATLHECAGDKRRAADLLQMSLKTLYNRLNVYRAEGASIPQA
ncbi:MAG: sigma-54-dependent Fis family transcriptional regulator [Candidatus Eisenbacteria bacterium]|nr:sigma-54-dependent Fis family transcriptional regulator [Candidatus Eisenbacteria bacterium]